MQSSRPASASSVNRITPVELTGWLADPGRARPVLLDVREPWEFHTCRIADSRLIPMRDLPARADELDASTDTVVICHHGARSMQAAMYLERRGFARLHNLEGGVDAWARSVDRSMPVY